MAQCMKAGHTMIKFYEAKARHTMEAKGVQMQQKVNALKAAIAKELEDRTEAATAAKSRLELGQFKFAARGIEVVEAMLKHNPDLATETALRKRAAWMEGPDAPKGWGSLKAESASRLQPRSNRTQTDALHGWRMCVDIVMHLRVPS